MPNEPALPVDTVQDLLTNILRDGGIIGEDEQPEQQQITRTFRQINWLLARWARHRYLIYRLVDYPIVSTGAQTYSVGLGQSVNINPRPDRLESAFLRLLNSSQNNVYVDLPLDIIQSREDYNRIYLKNLGINSAGGGGTIAWRIFYDPVWPIGVLYPWPIPQATLYEIHVTFKETIARFASLQQKINFPPEYEAALNWNGAQVMRAAYQMPADPMVNGLARSTLNDIRLAAVAISTLDMPDSVRTRGRAYDYHSDR